MFRQIQSLNPYRRLPARPAAARLKPPFQQMQQQDSEATDQFALFGPAHALDFLGDVFDVGLNQLSGAQQLRLLKAPGKKIAIIERGLRGHGEKNKDFGRVSLSWSIVRPLRPPVSLDGIDFRSYINS